MRTRTATGIVKFWLDNEGWGVLTSPAVPREVWVPFSAIEGTGYKDLNEGDKVEFSYHGAHQEEELNGVVTIYSFVADLARRL
jgi:cold shock protein